MCLTFNDLVDALPTFYVLLVVGTVSMLWKPL